MINKIRQCCNNDCNQGRYCELKAFEKNKKSFFVDHLVLTLLTLFLLFIILW